jgi:hypothetical protein
MQWSASACVLQAQLGELVMGNSRFAVRLDWSQAQAAQVRRQGVAEGGAGRVLYPGRGGRQGVAEAAQAGCC